MQKPVIVSGIQPTGALHIGNYLGALRNFVELQNSGEYSPYFFIADLHSLTDPPAGGLNPEEKTAQILDVAASYLAAGLNPKKSTLFIQSHVGAHTELGWILNCLTPMGELSRMTQFKDKSETGNVNAGLFTYPVLMAADIFLYNAAFVPVGDDQDQHLELARNLARKFNSRFGITFIEPKGKHTLVPRLMSLDEPTKKMSKSRPAGCLFMDDKPEIIEKKIMTAVTDSGREIKYDPELKPGISNLLLIESALTGIHVNDLVEEYGGDNYGEFKKSVIEAVTNHFTPFREMKLKLLKNPKRVMAAFKTGDKKANAAANSKLKSIKQKIGLL
ncbi:MAG: tryptophan--tRNA ligase [bacterium]|nr:tryptophan--tRNA ligase [bacterium]